MMQAGEIKKKALWDIFVCHEDIPTGGSEFNSYSPHAVGRSPHRFNSGKERPVAIE
jgi:hypothetical protein